jgi:hypothetical protein
LRATLGRILPNGNFDDERFYCHTQNLHGKPSFPRTLFSVIILDLVFSAILVGFAFFISLFLIGRSGRALRKFQQEKSGDTMRRKLLARNQVRKLGD